jgi:hypothetical protein
MRNLIVLVFFLKFTVYQCKEGEYYECSIYNSDYEGEYLYADERKTFPLFFKNFREINLHSPIFGSSLKNTFTVDDKRGVWRFEPLPILGKNYFYIHNSEYEESLFSSNKIIHKTNNRYAYTYNMKEKRVDRDDEKDICEYGTRLKFAWQLKPVGDNYVEIRNAYYEEPLYTLPRWMTLYFNKRPVYTHRRYSGGIHGYKWFLACKNNYPKLKAIN